jgi:hypothetical protein
MRVGLSLLCFFIPKENKGGVLFLERGRAPNLNTSTVTDSNESLKRDMSERREREERERERERGSVLSPNTKIIKKTDHSQTEEHI